jgi:hypothetical protein
LSPDSLYPEAITACADEPKVPPRPVAADGAVLPRSDAAKAAYTKELHDAWGDCHDTVASTAQRKADYAKQFQKGTRSGLSKLLHFGH